MNTSMQVQRRHDIDWLRILAIVTVFIFHCSRFFDTDGWHVKNNQLSEVVSILVIILAQWIMPLFFVISAVATRQVLMKASAGRFLVGKLKRLAVPFLIGTFIFLIPIQVYIERVSHGDFNGSFWTFYPLYFDGWYGFGGNFAWMGLHLWYLEVLLVFSILTLPIFLFLNQSNIENSMSRFFARTRPLIIFIIPVLTIAMAEMFVNQYPDSIGIRDFGGWSLVTYFVIFFLGYVYFNRELYIQWIKEKRLLILVMGMTAIGFGIFLELSGFSSRSPGLALLRAFNTWCWLSAIIGYGARYLKRPAHFSDKAGTMVLPFYILHQTVIVVIGFGIRHWPISIPIKFILLAGISFLIILVIYEIVIRPFSLMRFLTGMKTKPEGWFKGRTRYGIYSNS